MKKIIALGGGFIGFVIISIAMQSSQLNFENIIREFKGEEETENVLYLTLKFIVALILGFVIIYNSLNIIIPNKEKILKTITIVLFIGFATFRIYHFINYDENELIDRTNSKNWIMNYEEAVCFYTPEGMDKLYSNDKNLVKYYKDDNITIFFAEEIYDNYSKKSDIDLNSIEELLKKYVLDITKIQLNEIELLNENYYGNVKEIVLQANLNNRGFARIYAIERNSDITALIIFTKNTENSEKAFNEFLKRLKFLD